MAALEDRVLTKLLKEGSLSEALRAGLTDEHFKDPEARRIFQFIYNHWHHRSTYNTLPTVGSIKRRWPGFQTTAVLDDDEGELRAIINEIKVRSFESSARALADHFAELVDEDPKEAVDTIQKEATKLRLLLHGRSELLGVPAIARRAREYYENVKKGLVFGLPWPWNPLTEDTLGKRPGDFIIIYGRMKQMKCVAEGQRILQKNGERIAIEDLPKECVVPSYTQSTGKMRWARAQRVVSGTKSCIEVVTESGLKLVTSTDHLYMTPGGYTRIKHLREGDYIATARRYDKYTPSSSLSVEDAYFVGLLVGDGNYTRNEVQFTTKDPEILRAVTKHAKRYDAKVVKLKRSIEYRIVSNKRGKGSNKVLNLLRDLGIWGSKSVDKVVPSRIFTSTREAILAFLAGLLDTDGGCYSNKRRSVVWNSSSADLSEGVHHLLSRFGVRATRHRVLTNRKTEAYPVVVLAQEQHLVLHQLLSEHLSVQEKRRTLKKIALVDILRKRNKDSIPYSTELAHRIVKAKGNRPWPKQGVSQYKLHRGNLFTATNTISRRLLRSLASEFGSERLLKEATNDIIWERIKSVSHVGRKPCYDICIKDEQDPNFAVEGFLVHNTWVETYCAAMDYQQSNARVLFWSRDMSMESMALRLSSILAEVDYQLFKKGRLPPRLERKALKYLEALMEQDPLTAAEGKSTVRTGGQDIMLLCGRQAPIMLEEFNTFVKDYSPDIVYIDSYYHMQTKRGEGQRQRHVQQLMLNEDLKGSAIENDIPYVGITQANRLGEQHHGDTLADIADSDQAGKECDLAIRVIKKPGNKELYEDDYEQQKKEPPKETRKTRIPRLPMFSPSVPDKAKASQEEEEGRSYEPGTSRKGAELALVFGGNRDGVLEAIKIRAIPGYDFSLISANVSVEEIGKWVEKKKKKGKGTPEKSQGAEKPNMSFDNLGYESKGKGD